MTNDKNSVLFFFFFNDPAPTEISPLPLHAALPIPELEQPPLEQPREADLVRKVLVLRSGALPDRSRSEEHTSELQSQSNLVCRLLLEKKKKKRDTREARPLLYTLQPDGCCSCTQHC